MSSGRYYFVTKKGQEGNIVCFDGEVSNGFQITPKNQLQYEGITVQKLVIIKPSFISKLLKRKIQKKLERYLNYIVEVIDSDDESDGDLNEILSELTRYKDILEYQYRKYLDKEYVDLMSKKIEVLEYELKLKTMRYHPLEEVYEDTYENARSR